MDWTANGVAPPDEALEEMGTLLLRREGAFRRGRGLRSPRSERDARRKCDRWEEWMEKEIADLGTVDIAFEVDSLARSVGLSALECAILALSAAQDCSLRETAAVMGVTVYRVRVALARALRKLRRRGEEEYVSARRLFWEEVRQKQAAIYRPPLRLRKARRDRRESE